MKITYFRLKGYINILNGMGLEEIVIPFYNFKNRIVLIYGANGTGKSTLVATMSPNPDSSESFRTDVFIDENGFRQIIEYPAEKEIHYEDINEDGSKDVYKILIQSLVDESRTRRTTKAFISKNGEEMNPNGNVQSFKDIRDTLLGIDPVYLDLSSISAENRGIVDMIPSERRKYMAAYIGSLDTYNNIFKILSKKVSNLKSYMNTLNNKIYEIGDENELRIKLVQMESNLKDLNKERDDLLKELAEAEATVRIIDPNNEMQDLYVSISDRLRDINFDITKISNELDTLYSVLKLDPENHDLLTLKEETEKTRSQYITSQEDNRSKIASLISMNEVTLNTLNDDKSRLESMEGNRIQENVEIAIKGIKDNIDVYETYLNGAGDHIKILDKVSLDELTSFRDVTESFLKEVNATEDLGTEEEFIEASSVVGNELAESSYQDLIQTAQDSINANNLEIAENNRRIETLKEDLEVLNSFDSTRPKECKIDTCPYISKYIEMKNQGLNESMVDDLIESNKRLERQNINSVKSIARCRVVSSMVRRLRTAISSVVSNKNIISKIKELNFLTNMDEIREKLKSRNRFSEFGILDLLIEEYSIYKDLVNAKEQYKELESDLKIYKNNKSLIDSLTESIKKNQEEYDKRSDEVSTLTKDSLFLTGLINELDDTLSNINNAIEKENQLKSILDEKENLKKEFESVKDKIRLVKSKVDTVNDLKNQLFNKEESINPLSESINQVKFNLTNIVSYQNEYKESSDMYDKMVFVRNACSPGNGMGIQSEYIKRYMNDIIIDCNKMLGYMFNGQIQLDVPVINEKQFSIPFIGPGGIPVPDISNGSTAQKCMIGLVFSCVAMMKSSLKYNIPRFDEIDGGLDQQNRITFITVLNQVLDFMRSEQCIICSHNIEFDTQSTTRIVCTPGGIKIEE